MTTWKSIPLLHVVLDLHMTVEIALLRGSVRTVGTGKWLLPCVGSYVTGQFRRVDEKLFTIYAFERS